MKYRAWRYENIEQGVELGLSDKSVLILTCPTIKVCKLLQSVNFGGF